MQWRYCVVDKGILTLLQEHNLHQPGTEKANVTVKNATLNAENSEALVIEGQNFITLENTNVTGKSFQKVAFQITMY